MPVSVAQTGGAGYGSEGTCVQHENGKGTQGGDAGAPIWGSPTLHGVSWGSMRKRSKGCGRRTSQAFITTERYPPGGGVWRGPARARLAWGVTPGSFFEDHSRKGWFGGHKEEYPTGPLVGSPKPVVITPYAFYCSSLYCASATRRAFSSCVNYAIRISKLIRACAFRSFQDRRDPHKTRLFWFPFFRCAHSAHTHFFCFLMLGESMRSRIFPFPSRPSFSGWVAGLDGEVSGVRKHVTGILGCWASLSVPLPFSALEAGTGWSRVWSLRALLPRENTSLRELRVIL